MKYHQYAEAMWLSRRLKINSAFMVVTVCVVSIGSLILTFHAEQRLISRITAGLTVALGDPDR